MKKHFKVRTPFVIALLVTLILVIGVQFAQGEEIGKFQVSSFCLNCYSAQTLAFDDPKVDGVTCYVTNVAQKFSFSDPSNTSVSCRQVGPVSFRSSINKTKDGEDTFAKKKSWISKVMKVRRLYDRQRHVLLYVVYTTKAFGESYKVSNSAVVLPKNVSVR